MTKDPPLHPLQALAEKARAATPGPWCWEQCGQKEDAPVVGIAYRNDDVDCKNPVIGLLQDCDDDGNEIEYYRQSIAYEIEGCDGCSASSNAAFIAAANPSVILALVERLERAEKALRDLLVAVKYAAPPKDYGTPDDPNPCYEARVPVAFVENAEAALAALDHGSRGT